MGSMDETAFFGIDQGCPVHGDDYMKECTVCGMEYCHLCHPSGTTCPDCAAEEEDDLGGETREIEEPDFEDVEDVKDVLNAEDLDVSEKDLDARELGDNDSDATSRKRSPRRSAGHSRARRPNRKGKRK